ncbi:hypothetical protein CANCADRAFT_13578, partial [Tortispora caseinolytica NRRL Y-17796]
HHADNSNFASNIDRKELYEQINMSMKALMTDSWVSNLSNAAALLWHGFQSQGEPLNRVNWAGFYYEESGKLLLGPFQGKVACQEIEIGKGVCGKAALELQTVRIEDVDEFPGHIACDADSKSEIVVPIVRDGVLLGVLDIDCTVLGGFDTLDQQYLEELCAILS